MTSAAPAEARERPRTWSPRSRRPGMPPDHPRLLCVGVHTHITTPGLIPGTEQADGRRSWSSASAARAPDGRALLVVRDIGQDQSGAYRTYAHS